jgi:hypothetical protein
MRERLLHDAHALASRIRARPDAVEAAQLRGYR